MPLKSVNIDSVVMYFSFFKYTDQPNMEALAQPMV